MVTNREIVDKFYQSIALGDAAAVAELLDPAQEGRFLEVVEATEVDDAVDARVGVSSLEQRIPRVHA